jgi:hemoglobin-like flavoprotein
MLRVVLLETFHHYLGPRFTAQMQEAWEEAFEMISAEMLKGADMFPSQEAGEFQ